jgi:hypothetical protein
MELLYLGLAGIVGLVFLLLRAKRRKPSLTRVKP